MFRLFQITFLRNISLGNHCLSTGIFDSALLIQSSIPVAIVKDCDLRSRFSQGQSHLASQDAASANDYPNFPVETEKIIQI